MDVLELPSAGTANYNLKQISIGKPCCRRCIFQGFDARFVALEFILRKARAIMVNRPFRHVATQR
jgi:hypothetical protein